VFTARYVLHSTFCPRSVFMCFVWIWEQTAIISLYNIDWLVFMTETECVYCAVRSTFYVLPTQCVYVFCVDLRTNSDYFTVQHWLVVFYNSDGESLTPGKKSTLKLLHIDFSLHNSVQHSHLLIQTQLCSFDSYVSRSKSSNLRPRNTIVKNKAKIHNILFCGIPRVAVILQ